MGAFDGEGSGGGRQEKYLQVGLGAAERCGASTWKFNLPDLLKVAAFREFLPNYGRMDLPLGARGLIVFEQAAVGVVEYPSQLIESTLALHLPGHPVSPGYLELLRFDEVVFGGRAICGGWATGACSLGLYVDEQDVLQQLTDYDLKQESTPWTWRVRWSTKWSPSEPLATPPTHACLRFKLIKTA